MNAALTRHPWNVGFEWVDATGPFTTLSQDQVRQFDEDGFIVVPDLFTPDEIAGVRDLLDEYEAESDAFLRTQRDGRVMIAESGAITFTTHLASRAPLLTEFARHPKLVGICLDLVGPDVNLYWDQAVYKKPEKPRR